MSALNSSFSPLSRSSLNSSNSDLIFSIKKLRHQLPTTITKNHVEAHQDNHTSIDNLPIQAQLNIFMDLLAKDMNQQYIQNNCSAVDNLLPLSPVRIYYRNIPIVDKIHSSLYYHITAHNLKYQWVKYHRYPESAIPYIDWTLVDKVSQYYSLSQRLFLAKWVSGECGIGHTLRQRKYRLFHNCPFCLHPDETTTHLLLCPHDTI